MFLVEFASSRRDLRSRLSGGELGEEDKIPVVSNGARRDMLVFGDDE